MQAIETWLENALSIALISSSAGEKDPNAPAKGVLKTFNIDRESLSQFGISRPAQDR